MNAGAQDVVGAGWLLTPPPHSTSFSSKATKPPRFLHPTQSTSFASHTRNGSPAPEQCDKGGVGRVVSAGLWRSQAPGFVSPQHADQTFLAPGSSGRQPTCCPNPSLNFGDFDRSLKTTERRRVVVYPSHASRQPIKMKFSLSTNTRRAGPSTTPLRRLPARRSRQHEKKKNNLPTSVALIIYYRISCT